MRKQKGFSLIELLIVVAIILIIAAIAIPNLLRSRMAANEASAVGSVRTINTAQVTFATTYPDKGFTVTLSNLGGTGTSATSTSALLIDSVLSGGKKSGYSFALAGGSGAVPEVTYTVTADPITQDKTGVRHFFSDQSGVVRYDPATTATVSSNPLQ
jgi:type IV pilus assembly protein PilA